MTLTRRGVGLLAAAVVLFAAGEALGYAVLRVLAGAAFAAVVAAVAGSARRLPAMVRRDVAPDRVERGQPALARLVVRNPSQRRTAGFTARDPWDGGHAEIPVRPLAPGAESEHTYLLPTGRRGRLVIGPLTLERNDPLGLVRARATAGSQSTLWVHPRRYSVRTALGTFPRHHHEGVIAEPPMRGSMDLRAVREYVTGDEPRHVHWKATARAGRLMVCDYVDPAQPRFAVLLDTRARVLDTDGFEGAVEMAASLAHASAAQGHRTALATTTGLVVNTAGGLAASRQLLDRLCEVTQTAGQEFRAQALLDRLAPGGCLVYLSGGAASADPGLLAVFRRTFGKVAVFDMAPIPSAATMPGVLRLCAREARTAAAAWNAAAAR